MQTLASQHVVHERAAAAAAASQCLTFACDKCVSAAAATTGRDARNDDAASSARAPVCSQYGTSTLLGVDIPMTNLGETSAQFTLLF